MLLKAGFLTHCEVNFGLFSFLFFCSSFYKNEEDDAPIKRCPKCKVYIERDEGCAQMMCKNCKHAFCWYCLESLDVSWLFIICSYWSLFIRREQYYALMSSNVVHRSVMLQSHSYTRSIRLHAQFSRTMFMILWGIWTAVFAPEYKQIREINLSWPCTGQLSSLNQFKKIGRAKAQRQECAPALCSKDSTVEITWLSHRHSRDWTWTKTNMADAQHCQLAFLACVMFAVMFLKIKVHHIWLLATSGLLFPVCSCTISIGGSLT